MCCVWTYVSNFLFVENYFLFHWICFLKCFEIIIANNSDIFENFHKVEFIIFKHWNFVSWISAFFSKISLNNYLVYYLFSGKTLQTCLVTGHKNVCKYSKIGTCGRNFQIGLVVGIDQDCLGKKYYLMKRLTFFRLLFYP